MISLSAEETLTVDAGSNANLVVHCRYVYGGKRKAISLEVNASRVDVVKGFASIDFLSVYNGDASAQVTQVMIVSDGVDGIIYGKSLASKSCVLFMKENVVEI